MDAGFGTIHRGSSLGFEFPRWASFGVPGIDHEKKALRGLAVVLVTPDQAALFEDTDSLLEGLHVGDEMARAAARLDRRQHRQQRGIRGVAGAGLEVGAAQQRREQAMHPARERVERFELVLVDDEEGSARLAQREDSGFPHLLGFRFAGTGCSTSPGWGARLYGADFHTNTGHTPPSWTSIACTLQLKRMA